MRRITTIISALIILVFFILTGCQGAITWMSIINQPSTNIEYQNKRLCFGITESNKEVIKEAILDGATIDEYKLDRQLYIGSNMDFPNTALGYAIGLDSLKEESIIALIQNGADINQTDKKGRTYLIICAENTSNIAYYSIVFLLKNGADPNAVNKNGDTALEILLNKSYVSEERLDAFIESGIVVSEKTMQYAYKNYKSIDIPAMRKLTDYMKKNNGITGLPVLAEAAIYGDNEVLKAELKKGISKKDINFVTAYAAAFGNPEVLQIINNQEDVNLIGFTFGQLDLLTIAAGANNFMNVQYLVDYGADVNGQEFGDTTPLNDAIKNNNIAMVKYLLENGAEFVADKRVLPFEISLAAENGNIELIELLFQYGLSRENNIINNAMVGAIRKNQIETLRYLINKNINQFISTDDLNDTLAYAIHYNNIDAIQLLINAGADVNKLEDYPLLDACENGKNDAMKLLIANGANFDFGENKDGAAQLLRTCITWGNVDELMLLIDNGIDVNVEERENKISVITDAAQFGSSNILQALIDAGADINTIYSGPNDEEFLITGDTPLHAAARYGWRENVKTLLEAGADITIKNSENMTAYEVAKQINNKAIIRIFEEAGYNK